MKTIRSNSAKVQYFLNEQVYDTKTKMKHISYHNKYKWYNFLVKRQIFKLNWKLKPIYLWFILTTIFIKYHSLIESRNTKIH